MRGTVLTFSIKTNQGYISGDNNKRYEFTGADWNLSVSPEAGIRVDFDADGNKAYGIYEEPNTVNTTKSKKSKTVTILLTFFLGGLGVHYFYLGAWGWGLIFVLFCWTYIPLLISLISFVRYIVMSESSFDQKVNKRKVEPFDTTV